MCCFLEAINVRAVYWARDRFDEKSVPLAVVILWPCLAKAEREKRRKKQCVVLGCNGIWK